MKIKIVLVVLFVWIAASCKQQKKINFDKIVFHSSFCYGECPVYHLEVTGSKNAKLFAETVFSAGAEEYKEDKAKMGYFTGKVNDSSFNKLNGLMQSIGIDTLNFGNRNGFDAPVYTVIVYNDVQRQYFKAMFPTPKAEKLISVLLEICEKNKFKRTKNQLEIESDENK
jgi:hypothetical protein